jgi:serine/threonine protein kinase
MATTFKKGTILGLLPGDIIEGRFQIGELIGYGGQGAVLSVNHLEWDRELALKLPLPDAINSPKKTERFVREAEAWIRLGVHPNIVRCWFVRKINGLPGLFLDLISGGSLEDKIKSGELGPGKWNPIIEVMIGVAEGLAHSHSLGMVHRDIKPENLLLRRSGEVCVTDFGLVKSADRESLNQDLAESEGQHSEDSSATGVGEFLGTPRYGAPEQWNKDMTISPATDIYAVGVILFELLTGRRPYDAPGENPDPLTLIHRHLKNPVPKPSDFQADVPADLERLCLNCLDKDPKGRPQTGMALVPLLVHLKEKNTGLKHARPTPLPEKERPALLNNAGVSLLSLGRLEKGRENIEKGLLLQADHPECIYNLVQLERRAGRMGEVESLQRLRRANAALPLALLCIEEGHSKLAYQIVSAIPDEKKSGLLHRTEGDALMYIGEFDKALECYKKAKALLPSDRATFQRMELAEKKARSYRGQIYFPISTSLMSGQLSEPGGEVLITDKGNLVSVSRQGLTVMDARGKKAPLSMPRPTGSQPVVRVWHNDVQLLVQDETGFELWNKEAMKPLGRSPGMVLAASRNLSHIFFVNGQQALLLDNINRSTSKVALETPFQGTKACFDAGQTGLYILTPDGKLGKLNSRCEIEQLDWPPQLPDYSKIRLFRVFEGKTVCIGTEDKKLLFLDLVNRTLVRSSLPFRPEFLRFDPEGELVIVGDGRLHGVFQTNGRPVHRGKGACAVDDSGRFLLAWAGTLNLYSVNPFYKVRSYSQKIPPPEQIRWTLDGRFAVTVRGDQYHVWEVDEDHRVCEREYLLTPGETYEDLIQSYVTYSAAMKNALAFKEKRRYAESYLALRDARAVRGFLQSEHALTLQWELCTILERDGLEALWERMFFRGITAVGFTRNGRLLAMARGKRVEVQAFTGTSAQSRFSIGVDSLVDNLHFHNSNLLIVESNGTVQTVNAADGSVINKKNLGMGEVAGSAYRAGHLVVWGKDDVVVGYDPTRSVATAPRRSPFRCIVPMAAGRIMCAEGHKVRIINLRSGETEVSLALPPGLTCLAPMEDDDVILAGYQDGTLRAIEVKTSKEIFSVHWDVGALTGVKVNRALAFGVAVSQTGRLTVFDLGTGREYLSFTGHSQAIPQLEMTDDGRYLLTRSSNGQFRLWETCWTLNQREGTAPIVWLDKGALGRFNKFLGR